MQSMYYIGLDVQMTRIGYRPNSVQVSRPCRGPR